MPSRSGGGASKAIQAPSTAVAPLLRVCTRDEYKFELLLLTLLVLHLFVQNAAVYHTAPHNANVPAFMLTVLLLSRRLMNCFWRSSMSAPKATGLQPSSSTSAYGGGSSTGGAGMRQASVGSGGGGGAAGRRREGRNGGGGASASGHAVGDLQSPKGGHTVASVANGKPAHVALLRLLCLVMAGAGAYFGWQVAAMLPWWRSLFVLYPWLAWVLLSREPTPTATAPSATAGERSGGGGTAGAGAAHLPSKSSKTSGGDGQAGAGGGTSNSHHNHATGPHAAGDATLSSWEDSAQWMVNSVWLHSSGKGAKHPRVLVRTVVLEALLCSYLVGFLPLQMIVHEHLYYDLVQCCLNIVYAAVSVGVLLTLQYLLCQYDNLCVFAKPYARGGNVAKGGGQRVAGNNKGGAAAPTTWLGGSISAGGVRAFCQAGGSGQAWLLTVQWAVVLSQTSLMMHSRRWPLYASMLVANFILLYLCIRAKRNARLHWEAAAAASATRAAATTASSH